MFGTVAGLCRVAVTLSLAGEATTAVRLLSAAEALREEIGYRGSWLTAMNEETLTTVRSQLDEGAFAEAWEQGKSLTVDEAVALAFDS
jgi:hypothetical protein